MSAIVRNECYSRRGAYAPPLTPSVKGGGRSPPTSLIFIYWLISFFFKQRLLMRRIAQLAHELHDFTTSIQIRMFQVRIPRESLQIFSSIKPAWRRGGFQGTWETLTPLTQRQSTQAHNLGVTGSKPVGGIYPIISHRCIKALEQP